MTCVEFQELAGLLAAGALEGEELAQAEAHLAQPVHQGCFEALRRASSGVEALARTLAPERPDEKVWRNIAARIEPAAAPEEAAAPLWRERLAWGTAAAAAVLLMAALLARSHDNRSWSARHAAAMADAQRAESQRSAAALSSTHADAERLACARELSQLHAESDAQRSALLLLESPGTQIVTLAPPKGRELSARALLNLAERRGVLVAASLSAPSDRDYELWIIRGTEKVPAGLLRPAASGAVVASIDPSLLEGKRPDAVAITLEAKGGAPQPAGPIVLVGALPKS